MEEGNEKASITFRARCAQHHKTLIVNDAAELTWAYEGDGDPGAVIVLNDHFYCIDDPTNPTELAKLSSDVQEHVLSKGSCFPSWEFVPIVGAGDRYLVRSSSGPLYTEHRAPGRY